MPPDYYKDELYFKNTRVIKELFDKLELDNLQMIHQMQELEQSYEDLLEKEQKQKEQLTQLYDEQNKGRIELRSKIDTN